MENDIKAGNRHNRSDKSMVQEMHNLTVSLGASCGFIREKDRKEMKLYAISLDGQRIPIDLVLEDESGSIYLRIEHGAASFSDFVKASRVNCPQCKETLLVPGEGYWRCMNCSTVFLFGENGVTLPYDSPIVIPPAELAR